MLQTEAKQSKAKRRMDLAIVISDRSCGCILPDIAEILDKRCPCRNKCMGAKNSFVRDPGPQDPDCSCDSHCGLCAGLCEPRDHVRYSDYDPAWIEISDRSGVFEMGDLCPDLCGHPHDRMRRHTGEHCPPSCWTMSG
jgi:hypothetical protein